MKNTNNPKSELNCEMVEKCHLLTAEPHIQVWVTRKYFGDLGIRSGVSVVRPFGEEKMHDCMPLYNKIGASVGWGNHIGIR